MRKRLAVGSALLISALLAVVVTAVSRAQSSLMRSEQERRLAAVADNSTDLARQALISHDRLLLMDYLALLPRQYPELSCVVVDLGGRRQVIGNDSPGLRFLQRPISDRDIVGSLSFGFDPKRLDADVARALRPLFRKTLVIGASFLALGLVGSLVLARKLLEPLEALSAAVQRIGEGQLDQTVPVRSNDEVGRLGRQFNLMSVRVKELNEMREDVLHTLTHELNTPLSALKGYLELWQAGKLPTNPKERGRIVDVMFAAVVRMESSLAGALLLFRARHRRSEPPKPLWVDRVLEEAATLMKVVADSKSIEFVCAAGENVAMATVEEDLLRQVIANLVSNAIKYTPERGRVGIGLRSSATEVVFWVSDTGPGIPPQDIERIFEKFDRSGTGRKSAKPGTGLGLAITRRAVDVMGGRVWVESEVGKGSVFYVALPRSPKSGVPTPAEAV